MLILPHHGMNSIYRDGEPEPSTDSVEIGGRTYRTVTIGTQTWLAENLDLKFDGLTIGKSGSATQARGDYYSKNETPYGKYGLLYNQPAVQYIEQNNSTLIPGWHVPGTAEWQALCDAVGGADTAGTKLKAVSGWPDSDTGWREGWGGDGTTTFNMLPSGYRYDDGSFVQVGTETRYWTKASYNASSSFGLYIVGRYPTLSFATFNNAYQYSLRLVKDS